LDPLNYVFEANAGHNSKLQIKSIKSQQIPISIFNFQNFRIRAPVVFFRFNISISTPLLFPLHIEPVNTAAIRARPGLLPRRCRGKRMASRETPFCCLNRI
jgi:hypothetical protein